MTIATRPPSIRFRGRSFLALVLAPEPPVARWIAELDALIQRSPAFFVGRAIVVDVAALEQTKAEISTLIAELHARDIRIMGVEGADPELLGLGLPPPMVGGRPAALVEIPDAKEPGPVAEAARPQPAPGLIVDEPVRSGQSVVFPDGDVTVVGSVASGAEIVAGGSIHIYGALRGRAFAGTTGNAKARIFCRKFEAELLAIDGLYKAADDMDPELRGRPVQAWLDGDAIVTTALD